MQTATLNSSVLRTHTEWCPQCGTSCTGKSNFSIDEARQIATDRLAACTRRHALEASVNLGASK